MICTNFRPLIEKKNIVVVYELGLDLDYVLRTKPILKTDIE